MSDWLCEFFILPIPIKLKKNCSQCSRHSSLNHCLFAWFVLKLFGLSLELCGICFANNGWHTRPIIVRRRRLCYYRYRQLIVIVQHCFFFKIDKSFCASFKLKTYYCRFDPSQTYFFLHVHAKCLPLLAIMKTSLFKYTENFTTKKWQFSDKDSDLFHISAQKHRLWVLVRTASVRQF